MSRLPVALLPAAWAAVPRLSEQIVQRIRAEVADFAGPRRGRLDRRIRDAVEVALEAFVRLAAGEYDAYVRVDEHFHALGRIEALAGMSIDPVRDAIRLADRSVWQVIRAVTKHTDVDGAVVADLGADVSAYLTYLESRVRIGYAGGTAALLGAGGRLLQALLNGRIDGLDRLAAEAGRDIAEEVVVTTAQRRGASPVGMFLPMRALVRTEGDRTIVVGDLGQAEATRCTLLALGPDVVVAESWPIPLSSARDAYRWTRRALALAEKRQLRPERRVIDCARHRMTLLLEADPALVESLEEEMLRPLYAEKPSYGLDLAETLVLLLQTGEPASALAKRLGTCAQTIRNRTHRLEELFGAQLADPARRLALVVVLNAVLPRWRMERTPPPRRSRGRR